MIRNTRLVCAETRSFRGQPESFFMMTEAKANDPRFPLVREPLLHSENVDCFRPLQNARDELQAFVRNGYLEGVLNLVKKDVSLVTAKSVRGRCALHVAVLVENPEVIEYLVKASRDAVHVADNVIQNTPVRRQTCKRV